MKINEVKEILSQDNPNEEILEQLRSDERSGVQKLLASFDKKQEKKLFYKKEYEKKSFYEKIIEEALAYAICEVSNEEIEKYNIYNAARIAMQRAVEQLKVRPDFLLIDAMPFENYPIPNFSMVKGDEKSVSIAAASVIAKVYRDRLMKEYAKKYPHYDFENNAGYGTKKHLEGLKAYGITPIHRRDFEPVKSMIKQGGNNE